MCAERGGNDGTRSEPCSYNIPHLEKAICVGIKGKAAGLQRPVQSITNSSLPFCSESFHMAEHVKALSHTSNRLYILAITTAFQFLASVLQRCAWCENFAPRTSFAVFPQELH